MEIAVVNPPELRGGGWASSLLRKNAVDSVIFWKSMDGIDIPWFTVRPTVERLVR